MKKIGLELPIKSRAKTQEDLASEKRILDFKIFLLHEQHKDASQVNFRSSHLMSFVQSSSEITKNGYSLNMIFDMPILELDKKVFVLAGEKTKRYIQFKKQIQYQEEETNLQVLKIVDISNEIMYDIANGEKKLLSLINATVSHDMRNPINAILSQNVKQQQVNAKFLEMMNTEIENLTVSKMKKRIEKFHKELKESISIQSSSTKILQYLVNDTLDFGLLRAGKFRKNSFNFNIKEAV